MRNLFKLALLIVIALVIGVSYRAIRKPWIDFRRAEGMFARGDCRSAEPIYRKLAVSGFSKRVEAIGRLCECALLTDREEDALKLKAGIDPDSPDALLIQRRLGDVFAGFGYFSEARELYRLALKSEPEDCQTRFYNARVMAIQGEFDEAVRDFQTLLGSCVCLAAGSQAPKGRSKCITDEYQECEIRREMAKVLAYQGKFPLARSEYMKSLLRTPKETALRWELARVIFWSGDPVEAMRIIESAADSDLSPEEAIMKADLSMIVKDYAGTESALRKILARDPDDDETRMKLAQGLSWGRKHEESVRHYKILVERRPQDAKIRLRYADALFCLGKLREAEKQLTLSLRKKPNVPVMIL